MVGTAVGLDNVVSVHGVEVAKVDVMVGTAVEPLDEVTDVTGSGDEVTEVTGSGDGLGVAELGGAYPLVDVGVYVDGVVLSGQLMPPFQCPLTALRVKRQEAKILNCNCMISISVYFIEETHLWGAHGYLYPRHISISFQ